MNNQRKERRLKVFALVVLYSFYAFFIFGSFQNLNATPSSELEKNISSDSKASSPQTINSTLTKESKPKELAENTNGDDLPGLERNRIVRQQQQNPWLFLHQYKATYDVFSDNDKLGTATRNLISTDNGWKIQMTTRIKKWMLSLKSNEFSEFVITDNKLQTRRFYTSSKVTFKSARIIEQLFDWDEKLEKGTRDKRKWELPIEQEIFDRMSHIVQLRSDLLSGKREFEYLVSYKGSRKSFDYSLIKEEFLKTPIGEINTVKIDRIKGDDSQFSVWLSPSHNYLPVKIAQIEQDKPDVVMIVKSFEYLETAPQALAKMESDKKN